MRNIIIISTVFLFIIIFGYIFIINNTREVHPFIHQKPTIENIAHRGGMGLSPENTIISFNKAIEVGADILEMDIHSTSDSVLVLLHDHKVNRTTDGNGYVWEFNLKALKQLNAGYYWTNDDSVTFPFRELKIEIPTLEEVFTTFPNFRLNIEIKQDEPYIIYKLCNMIYKYEIKNNVLIGSFIDEVLDEFREECPGIATSSGFNETKLFYGLNYLYIDFLYSPSLDVFEIPEYFKNIHVLNEKFIKGAHKKNIPIYAWTVNEIDDMNRLIKSGIDGIITDYPDKLSEILQKNNISITN